MSVPIVRLWQCLVDTVVKVFVVREDNVSADIVELQAKSALASASLEIRHSQSLLA